LGEEVVDGTGEGSGEAVIVVSGEGEGSFDGVAASGVGFGSHAEKAREVETTRRSRKKPGRVKYHIS
jgi:hypothetical protein